MATLAPFLAKRRLVAAPMPLLPPVMRAVLPLRLLDMIAKVRGQGQKEMVIVMELENV